MKKYEGDTTSDHVTYFFYHLYSPVEHKTNVIGQLLCDIKFI